MKLIIVTLGKITPFMYSSKEELLLAIKKHKREVGALEMKIDALEVEERGLIKKLHKMGVPNNEREDMLHRVDVLHRCEVIGKEIDCIRAQRRELHTIEYEGYALTVGKYEKVQVYTLEEWFDSYSFIDIENTTSVN